jgi:hypothetical protein
MAFRHRSNPTPRLCERSEAIHWRFIKGLLRSARNDATKTKFLSYEILKCSHSGIPSHKANTSDAGERGEVEEKKTRHRRVRTLAIIQTH